MPSLTRILPVALIGLGLMTAYASAAKPPLTIGDPAPELKPAKWLKGTPTKSFEKGKVYVVEFWATWCTPCKENIPHLTELAHKLKDKVSINGISIWESNDPTSSAYLAKVEKFVKAEGPKMDYNVAVDGPASTIGNGWMKAAGEGGIPCSFIIGRDGKIAWIGHPANMEATLNQVLAGTFNVQAAREHRETELSLTRPIRQAMNDSKYADAIKLIDQAIKVKPDNARIYAYDRLVAQFHADPDAAKVTAQKILEESGHDIGAYRMVASIFATYKDLAKPSYEYAVGVIEEALKKNEMGYMFMAMHAEVNANLNDFPGAVTWQEQSIKAAEGDSHAPKEFVDFLKKNLKRFQDGVAKAKG